MIVLAPLSEFNDGLASPFRDTHGIKKQLFISERLAKKLKNIGPEAGRTTGQVFSFCVKSALYKGAYKSMPERYKVIKPLKSVGVRLPRTWLADIKDLAWEKKVTMSALCDYFLHYTLSSKSTESWVEFFASGNDLVFSIWMYLYEQTTCQSLNPSYLDPQSLPKPLNSLKECQKPWTQWKSGSMNLPFLEPRHD